VRIFKNKGNVIETKPLAPRLVDVALVSDIKQNVNNISKHTIIFNND
jgi:hypothetical protein